MYNHAYVTLVADRQRAFMHAAESHRLIANGDAEPRATGAQARQLDVGGRTSPGSLSPSSERGGPAIGRDRVLTVD